MVTESLKKSCKNCSGAGQRCRKSGFGVDQQRSKSWRCMEQRCSSSGRFVRPLTIRRWSVCSYLLKYLEKYFSNLEKYYSVGILVQLSTNQVTARDQIDRKSVA